MRAVLRSQLGDMHPLATATLYQSSPLKFLWHYHQQFEMVLMIEGDGLRHVGDSLHEYSSGDFILMGPGLPHRYESSPSRQRASKGCDFIVVHFDPALFGTKMLADPAFLQLATLLSSANRGMTFDRATVAEISPLLHTLPTLTAVRRWATVLQILDVLSLYPLGRNLCSVEFSQGLICESDKEPMTKTCRFLQEHLHRNVSLDEISSVAGMSTSTFSRFFRRVSGLSFVQYVNELKMRTASMLLLETDTPIKAVASSSGFASTSYFHRRFVQAKGVTPADFRAAYVNHSNTSETTKPATSVNRKSRPIAR